MEWVVFFLLVMPGPLFWVSAADEINWEEEWRDVAFGGAIGFFLLAIGFALTFALEFWLR